MPKAIRFTLLSLRDLVVSVGPFVRKALAANGIEVALVSSHGSSDNLRLLREGRADLGFVQGGGNERATREENGLDSLLVRMLPQTPGIPPIDLAQSEACSRRLPFLTPAVLLRAPELRMRRDGADATLLERELVALERKLAAIVVPLSYADELYALRSNINLVPSRLQERTA